MHARKLKYVFLIIALTAGLALLIDSKPVSAHSPAKFAAQP